MRLSCRNKHRHGAKSFYVALALNTGWFGTAHNVNHSGPERATGSRSLKSAAMHRACAVRYTVYIHTKKLYISYLLNISNT